MRRWSSIAFGTAAVLALLLAALPLLRGSAMSTALAQGGDAAKTNAEARKGGNAEGKGKGKGEGGKGKGSGGPAAVRVANVTAKVLPASITVVAPLVGRQQIDVYSKVAGRVAAFGPKEGEAVKKDQLLLRVDRNDPGETFLSVPVLAPMSGWVGRWQVQSIGEAVTTQAPVATLVDDEALRAAVQLPAHEWLKVRRDTPVKVMVDDESRDGAVLTIARAADAVSGRGSVIVEVANGKHDWRAGLVARVTLGLEPKARLIIPASALFLTETGAHVFTVEPGPPPAADAPPPTEGQPAGPALVARRLSVKYKLVSNDEVEIVEGLASGDKLVTVGGNLLSPGAPVRVIEGHE